MVLGTTEKKGGWRSCYDRKKSNTSQLLESKFHSSPKCLICKQCWAQTCVEGPEKIEWGRGREPNDRPIAITCGRQQFHWVAAFQGKIRQAGKNKAVAKDKGVENILDWVLRRSRLSSAPTLSQSFQQSLSLSKSIAASWAPNNLHLMTPWINMLIKGSLKNSLQQKCSCEWR